MKKIYVSVVAVLHTTTMSRCSLHSLLTLLCQHPLSPPLTLSFRKSALSTHICPIKNNINIQQYTLAQFLLSITSQLIYFSTHLLNTTITQRFHLPHNVTTMCTIMISTFTRINNQWYPTYWPEY